MKNIEADTRTNLCVRLCCIRIVVFNHTSYTSFLDSSGSKFCNCFENGQSFVTPYPIFQKIVQQIFICNKISNDNQANMWLSFFILKWLSWNIRYFSTL